MELLLNLDTIITRFLNGSIRNPLLDLLMPVFDYDRYWITPLVLLWLVVMVFGGRRERLAGLFALVMVGLTDQVSSGFLKPFFGRIRPCNILAGLHMWKDGAWIIIPEPVLEIYRGSYAMPSSHAANTAGQFFWWGWAYPKTRGWLGGLLVLIGISRVYDGVHWTGDVLVGWGVGFVVFLILMVVAVRLAPALKSVAPALPEQHNPAQRNLPTGGDPEDVNP